MNTTKLIKLNLNFSFLLAEQPLKKAVYGCVLIVIVSFFKASASERQSVGLTKSLHQPRFQDKRERDTLWKQCGSKFAYLVTLHCNANHPSVMSGRLELAYAITLLDWSKC